MVEHDEAVRRLFVKKLRKAYEPLFASEKALKQGIPTSSKNGSSEMTDNKKNASEHGYLDLAKSKLELLYDYEKHYLGLVKDYKEEIKFATALQEDLRRERSQFFTQTLKEVIQTMKGAEIAPAVSAKWIQDLVESYTKSIDLSSNLAKTHVIEILSLLTSETKREAAEAKLDQFSTGSYGD